MKIVLIGMKSCGKTTTGQVLAYQLGIKFIELDSEIEKSHFKIKNERLTFREIYKKYGQVYFRTLETNVLIKLAKRLRNTSFIFACGGGTPMVKKNREILSNLGKIIFLDVDKKTLLRRIIKNGIPAFFHYQNDPKRSLEELFKKRSPVYKKMTTITIKVNDENPGEIVDKILKEIKNDKN